MNLKTILTASVFLGVLVAPLSFGQTLITNYTSPITYTDSTQGWSRGCPELDASVAGTNNFLVVCYRQTGNGEVVRTNKYSNVVTVDTNWAEIPSGGLFIFKINNPNNLSCVYTNTNGNSFYASGVINSSNKIGVVYSQPKVVTNAYTNYWPSGPGRRLETNILTVQDGTQTVGILTTLNNGTNWTLSTNPGSATPGFVGVGGFGAQGTNTSYFVLLTTNNTNKVVFNIYRVP